MYLQGHSPGSIGLLFDGLQVSFSADTLRFDGKSIMRGLKLFTMDMGRERESIRRIVDLDPDNLLVGHGVPPRSGVSVKVREFADTIF
jgi:glyoxylase-like metal-dependent hydrolase (beta-lactamase superfamily II)